MPDTRLDLVPILGIAEVVLETLEPAVGGRDRGAEAES
jgi:hypothetical protein